MKMLNRRIKGRYTKIWNKIMITSVLTLFLISGVNAIENNIATDNAADIESESFSLASRNAITNKIQLVEPQTIKSITVKSYDTRSIYEVSATQVIPLEDAEELTVEITHEVDIETEEITSTQKKLFKNGEPLTVAAKEIVLVENGKLSKLTIEDRDLKQEKFCVDTVKPLVSREAFANPVLSISGRFVLLVNKYSDLSPITKWSDLSRRRGDKYSDIECDNYKFMVVETNDLTSYLNDADVVKICSEDKEKLQDFVAYAKEILSAEAEEKIRELKLKKTTLDCAELPQLISYMTEDNWNVQPGQTSPYQQFVTPDDSVIAELAATLNSAQDAYESAVDWTWVSDNVLHGKIEKWLLPSEFLSETPSYASNPVPGEAVSDCSEQANTLVSLLRAVGAAAEDVRVAIGKVNFGGESGGHAWVEIKEQGKWLVLDPTCGSYYDEEDSKFVNRNGVGYNYWKYHPYPVEEVWAYYNDVYYTDEIGEDVTLGWSDSYDYELFVDADMLAGFIAEETVGIIFIYVAIAVVAIISLLFLGHIRMKGSSKQ